MKALFRSMILVAALLPAAAQAWWQDSWAYRKQITVDTSPAAGNVVEAAGRATLLVRLHTGNFNFADVQEDGRDLRFVAIDDKTPLKYHIESFDALLGVATIWVDLPEFPIGGSTDLWMYTGNPTAPPGTDTPGTFDPDYTLVYHFDGAAGAPPKDQTAYANNALNAPPAENEASIIGRGARFDGKSGLQLPATPPMNPAGGAGFSFSAWIKPDALQPQAVLYAQRAGATALLIGLDNGAPFVQVENNGDTRRSSPDVPIAAGQWTHLAVTSDKQAFLIYVNGQRQGAATVALPFLASAPMIGADVIEGAGTMAFAGEIDELRLSRIARSGAAILAEVASESPDSRLVIYGADEQQSSGGFGYFGVIFQSVTLDAWIVIGILGVMALLSWVVMYNKTAYVNTVDRANDNFMARFRKIGRNFMALENGGGLSEAERKPLQESSLYRLYQVGVAEIRSRENDDGPHVLSAEAIEAIRAAIDATLVRENQRLSKSMVVLTIAISGGPFLGLLGTVVGVMITFAAIAAAGDVNVNAIAPGIAAALLATIAGLAVAIPALFGYNYLLGRNKNVSANMQVFVDEIVTRMAELYRPGQPHAHALN